MASALCRDCGWAARKVDPPNRCTQCRGWRVVASEDLFDLSIAHVDCDAFYASVEKRDDPSLRDKPLIVGGGVRGVVSTCCYIARSFGVRSAMPMFKAKALCPHAEIRKPRMAVYVEASAHIRALFTALTPLVEPLSLDEAFLDLGGTQRLHGKPPAALLADLARRVEADVGVSISIGLAPNKFLAKIASDLDKPRGFAVIDRREVETHLAQHPVTKILGVGPATAARLERDGYRMIADLQREDPKRLTKRYGAFGLRLAQLSRGQDARAVDPSGKRKGVSSETTFAEDTRDPRLLDARLWRQVERVAEQLKSRALSADAVTLKLKTSRFQLVTRRKTAAAPIEMAEDLYDAAAPLLRRAIEEPGLREARFRLLGVGVGGLRPRDGAKPVQIADLFDSSPVSRRSAETAMDKIREKFGRDAIIKGRGLE